MKPPVAKKVKEIKNRVRDLKASFIVQLKAAALDNKNPGILKDPDQRLIPRVTGLVIREGSWLVRLADRISKRAEVEIDEEDTQNLLDADTFFKELREVHADEILKNGFIFRIDANFITYMEKLVLFVEKIDAQVTARIKAVATLDDEEEGDDKEIAAEIASEMTS